MVTAFLSEGNKQPGPLAHNIFGTPGEFIFNGITAMKEHDSNHPTLGRLRDQKEYYSRAAKRNRRWYLGIKAAEMVAAVAITALAWSENGVQLVGWLGLSILLLEGVQQLTQVHAHWIRYRSTLEQLKAEEHLFEAGAGPYRAVQESVKLLAERIEAILSSEHREWQTIIRSSDIDVTQMLEKAKRSPQA